MILLGTMDQSETQQQDKLTKQKSDIIRHKNNNNKDKRDTDSK